MYERLMIELERQNERGLRNLPVHPRWYDTTYWSDLRAQLEGDAREMPKAPKGSAKNLAPSVRRGASKAISRLETWTGSSLR